MNGITQYKRLKIKLYDNKFCLNYLYETILHILDRTNAFNYKLHVIW